MSLVQIPGLMMTDLLLSHWAAQASYLDFCSRFLSRASMLAGELNLLGHVMAPKGITTCAIQHPVQTPVCSRAACICYITHTSCHNSAAAELHKQPSMQRSKLIPPAVHGKQR